MLKMKVIGILLCYFSFGLSNSISWVELMNLNVFDLAVKLKLYELSTNVTIPSTMHLSKLQELPIHQDLTCEFSENLNKLEAFSNFDYLLKSLRVHFISSDDLKLLLFSKLIPFPNFTIISLQSEILSLEQAQMGLMELKEYNLQNEGGSDTPCFEVYLSNIDLILDHLSYIASNINDSCSNLNSNPIYESQLSRDGSADSIRNNFLYLEYFNKTLGPFLRGAQCISETIKLSFELQNLRSEYLDLHSQPHLEYLTITRQEVLPLIPNLEVYEQAFDLFRVSCLRPHCSNLMFNLLEVSPKCQTFEKFFYSLPQQEFEIEDFVDRNGYLTSRFFHCCNIGENVEECVPSLQTLAMYHQLMFRGILYAPGQLLAQYYPAPIKPKFLIMGVGGGELNSYLITKFPHFHFDQIEINSAILRTALTHFGMENFICAGYEFSTNSPHFTKLHHAQNFSFPNEDERECRSNVILTDATVYIQYLSSLIRGIPDSPPPTSNHPLNLEDLFYDYAFLDIYDSRSFLWEGTVFSGNSLPKELLTESVFQSIRTILRPNSGLAIFHLHQDGYYKQLFRQILNIFGKDQIVYLSLSENDSVILAGKDLFTWSNEDQNNLLGNSVPHPCSFNNIHDLNQEIHKIAKQLKIEIENIFLYDYAVDCEFIKEFI